MPGNASDQAGDEAHTARVGSFAPHKPRATHAASRAQRKTGTERGELAQRACAGQARRGRGTRALRGGTAPPRGQEGGTPTGPTAQRCATRKGRAGSPEANVATGGEAGDERDRRGRCRRRRGGGRWCGACVREVRGHAKTRDRGGKERGGASEADGNAGVRCRNLCVTGAFRGGGRLGGSKPAARRTSAKNATGTERRDPTTACKAEERVDERCQRRTEPGGPTRARKEAKKGSERDAGTKKRQTTWERGRCEGGLTRKTRLSVNQTV